MYEDLISDLREHAEWGNANVWVIPVTITEDLRKAADAIEELTGRNVGEWIPVTERLPEPDKTDSNGFAVQYLVMNGWRKAVARRTDKYWVLFGTSIVLEYVTHWMPLPEPPKE